MRKKAVQYALCLALPFIFTYGYSDTGKATGKKEIVKQGKDHAREDIRSLPVVGFKDLKLSESDKVLGSETITLASTKKGVLDITAIIHDPNAEVRIYNNSSEFPTSREGNKVKGKVILSSGNNYICLLIYHNGFRYSRSIGWLVHSTVRDSKIRFELTWSGKGDLDLHIDDVKSKIHCFYSSKHVTQKQWDLELDVDNTTRKGPENIRVYSAPSQSTIRCYVNYYGGAINQEITVRVYRYGVLSAVYHHTILIRDAKGKNDFDPNTSWIVDEFRW
ncbi:MAG: hypothetical protein IEMM0008_1210 [bacterium]|nr:MAG: hypothetical protein IEMM0008_1210 [bacterium]